MDFDKKVKTVLLEIGLSPVQSDFYIAVLKNGPAAVSKIAQNLKINRTNSYVIVDKLKELELVWEENKPQGKVLHARSYQSILNNLKKKEESLDQYKGTIQSLASTFDTFTSDQNMSGPKIKLFQSKPGLDALVDEILDSCKDSREILLYTNQESEKNFFSKKKHDEFIKRRVENGIKIKVLTINNEAGIELQKTDVKFLRETKLLPDGFLFNAEIYIYGNRTAMIDIKEEIIGVVTESEELSKIQRQVFDDLWERLGGKY